MIMFPHTGAMNYADTLPKIPAAALGYLDADFLSDALKKDPGLKVKMKLKLQNFAGCTFLQCNLRS
jgi:carboxypeptidase Q